MSDINTFEDLIAWQKSYALTLAIYQMTRSFPADERFELASQIRRAASSVPSNIAEGYGRDMTRDYIRFLNIARGSINEVRTQLRLSIDLGYTNEHRLLDDAVEVSRILTGLIRSLEARLKSK